MELFVPWWLSSHSLPRTPVAILILIDPRVQVKSVEGDSLLTNWNFNQIWSDLSIESVRVHAEIMGGVPQSNQSR